MAPRKRGIKGSRAQKKKDDPIKAQKKLRLQAYLKEFDSEVEDYARKMRTEATAASQQIQQLYDTRILTIPKRFHEMTIEQFKECNKISAKDTLPDVSPENSFITKFESKFESFRAEQRALTASKQKRTMKSLARKMKISTGLVNSKKPGNIVAGIRTRRALAMLNQSATPLKSNRFASSSTTPCNSRLALNSKLVVTPKFNPRTPLPNRLLRKPKVGEVIISMSGSPLQNCVPDNPENPGLVLSLGSGKMVNICDPTHLSSIESKELDNETKSYLQLVHEKLAGILQA